MVMNHECSGEAPIFMHPVIRKMVFLWFVNLFMFSE